MTTKNWQETVKEAQAAGFGGSTDPAPPGPYLVEVVSSKEMNDKNGNPYARTRMVIIEGPERGKKVWNNFTFNPQNPDQCEVFAAHLRAFGINDITLFPSFDAICTALIGRRAVAEVTVGEWKNVPRNETNGFSPPQSTTAPPAPPTTPTGTDVPPPPPAPPAPDPVPASSPSPPTPPVPPQPAAVDGPPPSPFAS